MIQRKTEGSVVCPKCGKLVSVSAKACYNCGHKNPGLWGYGPWIQKYFGDGSMVPIITAVSVVLYALSVLLDPSSIFNISNMMRILSPTHDVLLGLGMSGFYPLAAGHWWTAITAIYLHGSILHILFNMLWLRQLGYGMEQLFGTFRTFLIFTIAGVTGFLTSFLMALFVERLLRMGIGSVELFYKLGLLVPYTIGASGAIFGLFGALVYYGRRRGGEFGRAILTQYGKYAIVLFAFGLLFPGGGIDNLSHAGGFIGGFIAASLLGYQELRTENNVHRLVGLGVAGVTVVCFILAFVTGLLG